MNFDLKGFLSAEPLISSKAAVPVFEAVVNSIHSLQMSISRRKEIRVLIERNETSPDLFETTDESRAYTEPTGFRIIDNGVGFNDENLRSFDTCFSTYKQNLGAKGIGRFSWLKSLRPFKLRVSFRRTKNGLGELSILMKSTELRT